MKIIFSFISALSILLIVSSCINQDQLEYPVMQYRNYQFGRNDEMSLELPVPLVGESPYRLYSAYLRWEQIDSDFAGKYSPITTLEVDAEKEISSEDIFIIRFSRGRDSDFRLSRRFIGPGQNLTLDVTLETMIFPTTAYSKEIVDRFVTEDNELFEKILKTVRIKDRNGKVFSINFDYNNLNEKIQKIYSAPGEASVDFEMPYELVETNDPATFAPAGFQLIPISLSTDAIESSLHKQENYKHESGLTTVTQGVASYKVYAERRKNGNNLWILIEPVSEKTSLSVNDLLCGYDQNGTLWATISLDVKYERQPSVTEHYIDTVTVKIADVNEFTRKGKLAGTIPTPDFNITMLYNGSVKFDKKFEYIYFKNNIDKLENKENK